MKKLDFKDLYGQNFTIRFENVLKVFRSANDSFRQSVAKAHTTLLFLHKCSARFALPDGSVVIARDGDILLVPVGTQYTVQFFHTKNPESYTIEINLQLFDTAGRILCLSDRPFSLDCKNTECANLFDRINDNSLTYPSALSVVYSDLYQLFHIFTTEHEKNVYSTGAFASIAKAIDHLRCDDAYAMTVGEMARECNVSESYLRRQFKLYSGMSPAKYVRMRRIMTAKNLLRYSDMTLKEISDRLLFDDVSYFCRIFRQETGMTASQYRKLHNPE